MAGPLAGILRMRWRDFLVFNFLGAITWVSTIAVIGYLFGQFATLYEVFEKADLGLTAIILVVSAYWWHRYRKSLEREQNTDEDQ